MLFGKLQLSYITAAEQKRTEFTEDAACDSIPIASIELVLIEICAYNSGKTHRNSGVKYIIDSADGKLIRNLCAEIINYKQIASIVTIKIISAFISRGITEAALFKIGKHTDRARVHNIKAAINKCSCKRG